MGILVQNMTYTVSVPLYLILHVFTSPVSSSLTDLENILPVDVRDIALLPPSNIICFILPAILMYLPSPGVVSYPTHYTWNAIWQIFPVTQSACHWVLKHLVRFPPGPTSTTKAYLRSVSSVYSYVTVLCVASQLALLAVALVPASVVPPQWAPLFTEVNFSTAFIPYLPWKTPVLNTATALVEVEGRAELARLFLQWDIYCGGTAILAWAVYLHRIMWPHKGVLELAAKALTWSVLGGPITAAAAILWERDMAIAKVHRGKFE